MDLRNSLTFIFTVSSIGKHIQQVEERGMRPICQLQQNEQTHKVTLFLDKLVTEQGILTEQN